MGSSFTKSSMFDSIVFRDFDLLSLSDSLSILNLIPRFRFTVWL
ncbi:MAG TPA: hypothetical protein PLI30_06145 [Petrimonas sp.]|nr:hypothetical protein [Petrimonas sp.]